MLRWLLTVFVATMVLSALQPWLSRLGLGRLPGDLRLRLFGRWIVLPFASSLLVSMILLLIARAL